MQVKFTKRLIPLGATNRLGQRRRPTLITIHECSLGLGEAPPDRNLEYYIGLMERPKEGKKQVGYHYLVSDREIVQFIPDNEVTHHTGNAKGNQLSIGIERLVNEGTDFDKAISIQAKLTATLMKKWNIPLLYVVPHRYWGDVNCPARLLAGQNGGWYDFHLHVKHLYVMKNFFQEVLDDT